MVLSKTELKKALTNGEIYFNASYVCYSKRKTKFLKFYTHSTLTPISQSETKNNLFSSWDEMKNALTQTLSQWNKINIKDASTTKFKFELQYNLDNKHIKESFSNLYGLFKYFIEENIYSLQSVKDLITNNDLCDVDLDLELLVMSEKQLRELAYSKYY